MGTNNSETPSHGIKYYSMFGWKFMSYGWESVHKNVLIKCLNFYGKTIQEEKLKIITDYELT